MSICAFYRNRRILVTGLTGFKGLWLGNWLERLGARVSGLSLQPDEAMQRGWPGIDRRLKNRTGDVRDFATVQRVVAEAAPEVVFHLAAQPLVRLSYREPLETFATNVLGTAHVLEAARHAPSVRAVVVITSDKCYENQEVDRGYREHDPLGGHDPYSASKGCAEIVTAAYRRSFANPDFQVASARAGNVIGGGDWAADRLVPDMIRSLAKGEPVLLRRPLAVRPWQHVLEPLSGYLTLGARLGACGGGFASAWNFGPAERDSVSVRALAHEVLRAWGKGSVVEHSAPAGPHETQQLRLDSTKARNQLPWGPLLSVTDRVDLTVAWYKEWLRAPESVWDFTQQQIAAYETRIQQCPVLGPLWSPESAGSSAQRSVAA